MELRERYRSGDLVLFVGAGVSAAAGLPPWDKLVEELIIRAKRRGATVSEIEQLARDRRFVDAVSAAAHAIGKPDFVTVVKSALDDRKRVHVVPEIGKAIAALAPSLRAVLTTNLDGLLERAFEGRWPALYQATASAGQERRVILKLHGTLLDPDSWVLTRDQYDRALYNNPLLQDLFSGLFRTCTILFIGYGLADDDFDQLLARVRALSRGSQPRHHALVLNSQISDYWRSQRESAGVQIIPYANHADVPDILKWLAAGPAPPTSMQSGAPSSIGTMDAQSQHSSVVNVAMKTPARPSFDAPLPMQSGSHPTQPTRVSAQPAQSLARHAAGGTRLLEPIPVAPPLVQRSSPPGSGQDSPSPQQPRDAPPGPLGPLDTGSPGYSPPQPSYGAPPRLPSNPPQQPYRGPSGPQVFYNPPTWYPTMQRQESEVGMRHPAAGGSVTSRRLLVLSLGGVALIAALLMFFVRSTGEQACRSPVPETRSVEPPTGHNTGTLRTSADIASEKIEEEDRGTLITVMSAARGTDQECWYRVRVKGSGRVGWIHSVNVP